MLTLRKLTAVVCLLVLVLPITLGASVFESKKDLHISNLHQIDDDLYVFGEKLQMDGSISGDLLVFCYDARMAGTVAGSANFFARSVRQSGTILHSLRTFSEQATVEGNIGGSYLAMGSRIDVGKGAVIERDLTVFAAEANVEGLVKGNAKLAGGRVTLAGTIEGDVFIEAGKISIIPPAVIRGALVYESEKPDALDTTTGIILAGGVTWQPPKKEEKKPDETPNFVRTTVLEFTGLIAAFVFGIILVLLFRPYAAAAVDQLNRRWSIAFATGLLSVGALIVSIIILVIGSFIAIAGVFMVGGSTPVVGAILLMIASLMVPVSGVATMLGMITFYSAKIIVGLVIGALILKQARQSKSALSKSTMFLGLLIVTVACAIPYIGWAFCLATALLGAGALVLGVRVCRAQMPPVVDSAAAEINPPPAS